MSSDFFSLCQDVTQSFRIHRVRALSHKVLLLLLPDHFLCSNMYKKFLKAQQPPEPEPEATDGPLPPKPMLRFYLVGWGIALIVCGITAAVNVDFYTGEDK